MASLYSANSKLYGGSKPLSYVVVYVWTPYLCLNKLALASTLLEFFNAIVQAKRH